MKKEEIIREFVDLKPDVVAAYGYGSAIFNQIGYSKNANPQIDLILVVKDLATWYLKNANADNNFFNPKNKLGIYPVTYIKYKNYYFKTLTINYERLLDDLLNWKTFAIAGRMQKPLLTLKDNEALRYALISNRYNAYLTASILTDDGDNYNYRLLETICMLSYIGDIRNLGFENPSKVSNILNGNYENFLEIYKHFIDNEPKLDLTDSEALSYLLARIPLKYSRYENEQLLKNLKNYDYEHLKKIRQILIKKLYLTNFEESILLSLNALSANGMTSSLKYVKAKRLKYKNH